MANDLRTSLSFYKGLFIFSIHKNFMRNQMTVLQYNGRCCIAAVVQLLARASSLAELQPLAHTYFCQQILLERIEKMTWTDPTKNFLTEELLKRGGSK
jgi:hypothetical protein